MQGMNMLESIFTALAISAALPISALAADSYTVIHITPFRI